MSAVIETFDDPESVAQAAAALLAQQAAQTIEAWQRFSLVLSGGSTPRRLYQILAQEPYLSALEWDRIKFFWGDERAVPHDQPDSNFGLAWRELLQHLNVPRENVYPMPADQPDLSIAACDYQKDIGAALGVWPFEPPPTLDLVFLGMGADGHTASLFPHTEAVKPSVHWILPNFVPKLNAHRLTMTPALLNRARTVCFLVTGADKATILKEVLEGPHDPERLPSQLIQPESGHLLWFVDAAAASQLS